MKSISEQISSIQREIKMRNRMYPRWIGQNRIKPMTAAHEIACMESVLETLKAVKALSDSGYDDKAAWKQLDAAIGQEQGSLI